MSERLSKLRSMSEDELIELHDKVATSTSVGTKHYLDEIHRRENQAINRSMLRHTRWVTIMTVIITIATIVNVVLIF